MPRKAIKPKLSFAERLNHYPTYNPFKEGFGNPMDWKSAWDQVMGHDEAARILKDRNPLVILGFDTPPSEPDLKRRYRQLILKNHPDKNSGDPSALARTQDIIAAYSHLLEQVGST